MQGYSTNVSVARDEQDDAQQPSLEERSLERRIRRWGVSAGALLLIVVALGATVWLAWRLRVIVIPVFAAAIVAAALAPLARWLTEAKVPRGIASLIVLLGALGAIVGLGFLVAPEIADQFAGIDDAASEAADRFENWVDEERPFGFTGTDVADLRERIAGVDVEQAADAAGVSAVAGLRLVATALAAILLALVSSFFLLRDGPQIREAIVARARPGHEARIGAVCDGAVRGLRSFLAGAALLGLIEGTAVGVTLWLTGSDLALVMAVITFIGAFIPFIGAIIAGVLAVAVALVTGGGVAALIVGAVVLAVQQFDNDLLAPLIYGRLLQLHPLVVILGAAAGIEVAGVIGAFITVPLVAAGTGAYRGWSEGRPTGEPTGPPGDAGHEDADPTPSEVGGGGDGQAPG